MKLLSEALLNRGLFVETLGSTILSSYAGLPLPPALRGGPVSAAVSPPCPLSMDAIDDVNTGWTRHVLEDASRNDIVHGHPDHCPRWAKHPNICAKPEGT